MQRGDDDRLARSSFSFGGAGKIGSGGGGATDAKTAAQLRKLQRLVETLVVRELERGDGGLDTTPRQEGRERQASRPPQPQSQQQLHQQQQYHRGQQPYVHSGDSTGGGGGRKAAGRLSSNESDGSLDTSVGVLSGGGADAAAGHMYGTYVARGAGDGGSYAGTVGPRAGGRPVASLSAGLDEGLHLQVSALQGQLAVLNEQLSAAYRAAEGVISPHALGGPMVAAGAPLGARAQAVYGSGGGGAGFGQGEFGSAAGAQPLLAGGPPHATGSAAVHPGAQRSAYQVPVVSTRTAPPGSPLAHKATQSAAAAAVTTDPGLDGSSGVSGGGLTGSFRSRQVVEERAGREATAREDERLRNWIQELRAERRRLEDRLLDGDSGAGSGVRQLRDDLEQQVLSLSRQRDQLAAELHELGATRAANMQLAGQVEALEAALAAEVERVTRYKEVRPALEGRLTDVSASLEALRRQHVAAVEALAQERDAAVLKAKRNARRVGELEAALEAANADVRRLQDEVRSHMMTVVEMRASSDVMQSASQQMQANMESQAKETTSRLAAVQSQLESSQSECVILRRQLETAQQGAAALRDQLKDAHARLEVQASERERLVGGLAEEQRAVAAARQQAEALSSQLKVSEEARAEAARAASAQLEAVRRQHAADLAATQKQYESQLAVAEKQYLLLQRQYDAGLASNDLAAEASASLRRERDALWAETQNLRAELEDVRKEKSELSTKLTALRSEVRATLDDVARDRDARLAAAASQSEALVRDLREEAERRVAATAAAVKQEYEAKLSSVMDMADKLRAEVQEAQRQADKYRTTANHLKDQVRDLLLSRDAAERELSSERAFNEELNRILTTIRAEQQQQHLHQQHMSGLRLASPAD